MNFVVPMVLFEAFLIWDLLPCTARKSLRASQNPVTGRIRPAGRMLPAPALNNGYLGYRNNYFENTKKIFTPI